MSGFCPSGVLTRCFDSGLGNPSFQMFEIGDQILPAYGGMNHMQQINKKRAEIRLTGSGGLVNGFFIFQKNCLPSCKPRNGNAGPGTGDIGQTNGVAEPD